MSFKNLLVPLFLVATYFIVYTFFGSVAGTIVALILGCIELIYIRIREKKYDKIVIYTTLVFCLSGLVDIYAAGTAAARLQPIILECFICVLFGIFAFSNANLLTLIPISYRKDIYIAPEQINGIRRSTRVLFWLMFAHVLFSCFSLLYLPPSVACFIANPFLYIMLSGYFLLVFMHNRKVNGKMEEEEWLPIVNEQGKVTGKAPRSTCHSGEKLLHPVVHLHIINKKKEIFLQKRSMKKELLPGKWDTAVGGHVGLNEKVEEALKREALEELGISDFQAHYMESYIWESSCERELVFSFFCNHYDQIRINNDEVDEGRFWSKEEIRNGIAHQLLTPNFVHEYKIILKKNADYIKTTF